MQFTRISLSVSTLLFCLAFSLPLSAQTEEPVQAGYPAILADMTHVKVVQDSSITLLMQDKRNGIVRGVQEMSGFRVQIYSDNTPIHAKTTAIQLEERFSEQISEPIYVISTPPFFKVRIGDFKTQLEASAYKEEFIKAFPDMAGETYVVRDEHIQVRQ